MLAKGSFGAQAMLPSISCRVLIRSDHDSSQVMQFAVEGLQIGQQVVVMASPQFLRELAHDLGESGMRPEPLLRNGRLLFLTAPGCVSALMKPDGPLQRGPLRPNAPLLRWVSDWSWAYGKQTDPLAVLDCQRRVHDFLHSLGALSLCTARSDQFGRNSMLALLADHRRVVRGMDRPQRIPAAAVAQSAKH
ncbi:MAG: hypothetical protein ACRD1N_05545 [Terriglobia bacterium]